MANCPKPAEEAVGDGQKIQSGYAPTEAWLAKLKTGQPGFWGEILLSFFFL